MKGHLPSLTPIRSIVGLFVVFALALAFIVGTVESGAQRQAVERANAFDLEKLPLAMRQRIEADREPNAVPQDLDALPHARPAGGTILYAYNFFTKRLVSFDASAPEIFLTDIEITGIDIEAGDDIVGIDFRALDGRLYGVVGDYPRRGRVVQIDTATGQAIPVHPTNTVASLIDLFEGFDFHPADVIRNVGRERANRRLSPISGAVLGLDTPLTYAAGDPQAGATPRIVHTAYTITPGSNTSTLFGIDSEANTLVRIGGVGGTPSPNDGTITTIGPLGFDFTNFGGMDIAPGASFAYAALNISSVPHLVQIDLATGAGTIIGEIGSDDRVIDGLAISIGPLVFPSPTPTATPTATPTPTASPTATPFPTPTPIPDNATAIRAGTAPAIHGARVTVPIDLQARAGEKLLRFTLNFNPAVLLQPRLELTPFSTGSELILEKSQAGMGRIGVTIDLPTPAPPGNRRLAWLSFLVSPAAFAGTYPITFGGTPVPLEVRDGNGAPVVSYFEPGNIVLGQTAAGVEVSGRVLTADGRGLRNARVILVHTDGTRRVATTGSFGHYRFEDVEAGGSYVISVSSNRYSFTPRLLSVSDTLTDVNFFPN